MTSATDTELQRDDTLTRFQAGRTYWTRSICDYECVYQIEVTRRTGKSVWIKDPHNPGKETRRGIRIWDGAEEFDPFGRYSMSPVIRPNRICTPAQ